MEDGDTESEPDGQDELLKQRCYALFEQQRRRANQKKLPISVPKSGAEVVEAKLKKYRKLMDSHSNKFNFCKNDWIDFKRDFGKVQIEKQWSIYGKKNFDKVLEEDYIRKIDQYR